MVFYTYVSTNVFYHTTFLSLKLFNQANKVARLDRILKEKGSTLPSILLAYDKRYKQTAGRNLLQAIMAIVGTAFHWGINGRDLFPRGFVTTKGGGATGQTQTYLWRIKVGELVVPLN